MPDIEELRAAADELWAAAEQLRHAGPVTVSAFGGYGLAEAYDALLTAWTRQLAVLIDAARATAPAPRPEG